MALPKLETKTYTLTLPSTGEEIKYRAFLVKEQKILMMAQDSKDKKEIVDAMSSLISTCTFDKINPNTCPLFDAEYLFLKIRGKSVGDIVEVTTTCPDDKKTKANISVDINEIECNMTDEHTREIEISDGIKIIMNYPLLKDTKIFMNEGPNMVFDALESCIHSIEHGETVHNKVDITKKELTEFIDSLNTKQFEKLTTFFNTMPKLRHVVEITNPETKVTSEIILEGLDSFLV